MRKVKNFIASLFGVQQGREKKVRHMPEADYPRAKQAYPQQPIKPLFPTINSLHQIETWVYSLTEFSIWDWDCFRSVLISLAILGKGHFIPANRGPNCIFLDGLQQTFFELRHISAERQGRETSRVIFADRERSCLVISGKTHIGTDSEGKIIMEPEPNREMAQLPVLTIHVHPSKGDSYGLSDIDYISFLSDQRQIVMMICLQNRVLFAMKTTATPQLIAHDDAQRLISTTRNDIFRLWSNLSLPNSILAFNKDVCTEFGMVLYQTTDLFGNEAHRISVTS